MKFVHIADVHFDMPFTSARYSKKIVERRRLDARDVFYDTISFTKEYGAEMLFISGDLFEYRSVTSDTINFIISCLKRIPDVQIFIAPGNHDPLLPNSPYNTFEWPENVTIFTGEVGMFEYDDVVVYGLGFNDFEMDCSLINEIEVDKSKTNILVTHGTLDGAMYQYHDIKTADLKKFDYVALGHIHLPKIDDSRIIYPGSLVAGGLDEQGEHGLVYGEISKETCKVNFKTMDKREFKEITFNLTLEDEEKTPNEIIEKLKLGDDVYRIVFEGVKVSYMQDLINALKKSDKFICDIKDKTKLVYDLEEIATHSTLKGVFTKNMLNLLKENPNREEEINRAIELVYKNMWGEICTLKICK